MKKSLSILATLALIFQTSNYANAHVNPNQTKAKKTTSISCARQNTNTVSAITVSSYLSSTGHTVLSTPTQVNATTWTSITSIGNVTYLSTVVVSGSSIVGMPDCPI